MRGIDSGDVPPRRCPRDPSILGKPPFPTLRSGKVLAKVLSNLLGAGR